ncbi:hypothetical protein JN11_04290 [Mucilaginibacter frigoritolerans]|uniref:Uncharacterized protein n=1 Tax=Mucilaginibacter frigoritolerans TaxID=652788 RepID=A0A562TPP4_9SPHI|nr:hypothetical protein [Mucilaginibacter frigoritolerans]TWI95551.1 hypothetical protein JN11_04290 [Mucilaginibacter frigoritolerans]
MAPDQAKKIWEELLGKGVTIQSQFKCSAKTGFRLRDRTPKPCSKHVTQSINNKFITLILSIQHMENDTYHIKKYFIILMMMIYLFISSTYILFLPIYHFSGAISQSSFTSPLVINHCPNNTGAINANNTNARIQHLYKSIPENKRKVIATLLLISTIFTFLHFISSVLLNFLKKRGDYLYRFIGFYQPCYLKFCSIRI